MFESSDSKNKFIIFEKKKKFPKKYAAPILIVYFLIKCTHNKA